MNCVTSLLVALFVLTGCASSSFREKNGQQRTPASARGVQIVKDKCHIFAPSDRDECNLLTSSRDFDEEAVGVCSDVFSTISDLWRCYRTIAGLQYDKGVPWSCKQRSAVYSQLYACLAGSGR